MTVGLFTESVRVQVSGRSQSLACRYKSQFGMDSVYHLNSFEMITHTHKIYTKIFIEVDTACECKKIKVHKVR